MDILIIILIFLIIFKLLDDILKNVYLENFNNTVIFLDKNEVVNLLIENKDNYYKSFYKNDFYARNINSINDYHKIIINSGVNLDNDQKNRLIKLTKSIDKKLENINLYFFNGKKANDLVWKIGVFKDKKYEGGLPHTRSDVILLNLNQINYYDDIKLMSTLLHEKIHIYQKMYKNDVDRYLDINKFKKIKKRNSHDNIRANPDLDEFIYSDENFNVYKAIYNKNPTSIEDVIYYPNDNQSYEHPYEKMAIYLEKKII